MLRRELQENGCLNLEKIPSCNCFAQAELGPVSSAIPTEGLPLPAVKNVQEARQN
jgi:hypothetical protein